MDWEKYEEPNCSQIFKEQRYTPKLMLKYTFHILSVRGAINILGEKLQGEPGIEP